MTYVTSKISGNFILSYWTDIVCGLLNSFSNLRIKAIADVYNRGSLLDDSECFDKRWRQTLCGSTNIKILQRSDRNFMTLQGQSLLKSIAPLRLGTPITICRNLEISKGIFFYTVLLVRLPTNRRAQIPIKRFKLHTYH